MPPGFQFELAFEDIEKALRRRGARACPGGELGGHLREARAELRRSMDHELHALGAGKRRADKRVRGLKQVIGFETASRYSKVVHA